MVGSDIILFILLLLVLIGLVEAYLHRRNRSRIPIRVHVNGTRGKSTVVRLIAGALRENGLVTCAKTTGTRARMILPDGSEYPIFRPAGANVIEQVRIVAVAASYGAQALVIECMALQPLLQWLCHARFVMATHAVITNARADHLDVMGPEEKDVAWALAGSIPVRGKLFTAEVKHLAIFAQAARDRQSRLINVTPADVSAIKDEEMKNFPYIEHKENVALALRVCEDLGVDRETALRGMVKAPPDPGVMTISHVRFFGRHVFFVNAFAANDPESSEQLWNIALKKYPEVQKRIMLINCRNDRPHRSDQLGKAVLHWQPADHYLLMGTGTYFMSRAAISQGMPVQKLVTVENESDGNIFEMIIEMAGESAVVVGIGNAKGQGLSLTRFFRNRSILDKVVKEEIQ